MFPPGSVWKDLNLPSGPHVVSCLLNARYSQRPSAPPGRTLQTIVNVPSGAHVNVALSPGHIAGGGAENRDCWANTPAQQVPQCNSIEYIYGDIFSEIS